MPRWAPPRPAQPSAAGDGDDDSSDDPADTPDSGADDDESSGSPGDGDGQGQDGPGDDGRDVDSPSDAPTSHDPSGTGEIMDAGARGAGDADAGESQVDVTAEEQAWDEAMHQAMNLARAEGKLPGGVEGDGAERSRQHPRLAEPPAPLHDRRRAPRL